MKRLITVLLAGAMMSAIFAGCGSDKDKGSSSSMSQSSSSSSSSSSSMSSSEEGDKVEIIIKDAKLKEAFDAVRR